MANLQQTEIKVYSDSAATTQVGNTIITSGNDALNVLVNNTSLGATVNAGEAYYVKARALDALSRYSDWTNAMQVVTMPKQSLVAGTNLSDTPSIYAYQSYTLNNQVVNIVEEGIYCSKNASGSQAIKYTHDTIGGTYFVDLDAEDTNYYVIGWYKDSLGREWVDDWTNASQVQTGFVVPIIEFYDASAYFNTDVEELEIKAIADIITQAPINSVNAYLYDDHGDPVARIELAAAVGLQMVEFINGEQDSDGVTIQLNENTEYTITILCEIPQQLGENSAYVTTPGIPTSNITITVTNVTSNSAYITWLVEGNSSLQPTVTLYVNGGGNWYYPQTEDDYGQWSIQLNGLQSGTTYTVYGEVEVAGQQAPGTDTKYFTTL